MSTVLSAESMTFANQDSDLAQLYYVIRYSSHFDILSCAHAEAVDLVVQAFLFEECFHSWHSLFNLVHIVFFFFFA